MAGVRPAGNPEKELERKLANSINGVTPGLCLQVYVKGKKKADLRIGKTFPLYDWASLTKIMFTTSVTMRLHDEKKIPLRKRVDQILPWFPSQEITVKHLLTHSASLTWWRPYYKKLKSTDSTEQRWQKIEGWMAKQEKPRSAEKAIYSDLDFFTLGRLLEELGEASLEDLWLKQKQKMPLDKVDFNLNNKPKYQRKLYAPTEECPWRGKVLRGEVHDDNAWALGGIAPHAGLFGPINSLSKWGLEIRKGFLGKKNLLATPETVQKFTRRQVPSKVGDWGLGFMLPTKGSASCGHLFSPRSFGHTGFVGTSLWFDPRRDILVNILSNRVYPSRQNKKFISLRPEIHNWIAELF